MYYLWQWLLVAGVVEAGNADFFLEKFFVPDYLKYFDYLYNLVGLLDLFHLRMSRNKIVESIHFHLQLMASQLLAWELKNESVVEHVLQKYIFTE